jgi:hypothetical protein
MGSYSSPGSLFYKPDLGASGSLEKAAFDAGLDAADAAIAAKANAASTTSSLAAINSLLVKNDGTVNPNNLLYNGNFEDWSVLTGDINGAPDSWTGIGANIAIDRVASPVKISTYSMRITRQGTDCYVYQNIATEAGITYWRGRTVTLGCWVYAPAGSTADLWIQTGGTGITGKGSAVHPADGAWHWLMVTHTVNSDATVIECRLRVSTTNKAVYFDGAMAVEGESSFAFNSKPAQEGTWINYSAISTITGWSSYTSKVIYYKRMGHIIFVVFSLVGPGNGVTQCTFTLPFTSSAPGFYIGMIAAQNDGGAYTSGMSQIGNGVTTVSLYRDPNATAWSGTGTRAAQGSLWYVAA